MRSPDGDPVVLLRAGRRCAELAAELAAIESTIAGHGMRWSGTAAATFSARAVAHRRAVGDTRRVVERLGALVVAFAHELTDEQMRARCAEHTGGSRAAIDERITLLRARFHRQLSSIRSDLAWMRLRLADDPGRWTGPPVPPGGWRMNRVPLPPCRWTGPPVPPGGWRMNRVPLTLHTQPGGSS